MQTTTTTGPIPITKPYFDDAEKRAVVEPLESGWVVQGPKVAEFEARLSRYFGSPHVVAVNSCTTALHLAATCLGAGPGDEVIVPAFTWIATANCVEYTGARPVFVDIDLETFNLEPASIQARITDATVGILPVHLFGLPAPMDAVVKTADEGSLWVVEDAACGFGARFRGRHVGTFGAAGAFSFHPRKSITTGEGGCLVTADPAMDRACRSLREHGATVSEHLRHVNAGAYLLADYPVVGFNYRMTDLQGAVGCAQMDKADHIVTRRAERAARYLDLLADLEHFHLPAVPSSSTHGWQSFVARFGPERVTLDGLTPIEAGRNRLMSALEGDGIATRVGTHAAAHQEHYAKKYRIKPQDFPNSYIAERTTISLPLYAQMTDDEQDRVVGRLRHHLRSLR